MLNVWDTSSINTRSLLTLFHRVASGVFGGILLFLYFHTVPNSITLWRSQLDTLLLYLVSLLETQRLCGTTWKRNFSLCLHRLKILIKIWSPVSLNVTSPLYRLTPASLRREISSSLPIGTDVTYLLSQRYTPSFSPDITPCHLHQRRKMWFIRKLD